ncbi:DUF2550 family protein [Actinomycetaceae bacterium L2_0104]
MHGDVLVRWALIVAAIGLILAIGLTVRFLVLVRIPGALHCTMRRPDRKWRTGILLLGLNDLQWYRSRSLRLRPQRVIAREDFAIVSHRFSSDDPNTTIIKVTDDGEPLVIAMNAGSFAGLVSWIDSAPPGVGSVGY